MSDNKLGLAILGAGIIALEGHVPAIKACSEIDFKAIYSRSFQSAKSFSLEKTVSDFHLDIYHGNSGLDQLLARQDIQAVIIALPISVQPSIIEKALKAGKHVLSEKPIAPDVETARRLTKLYETNYKPRNISWRVAEDYAHEPGILRAGELVRSGKGPLGPVLFYECKIVSHIESGNRLHATEWRRFPQHQGGFILDGGVHVAAALRVVLGDAAPTHMTGQATLHRSHLVPYDTLTAITSRSCPLSEPSKSHTPNLHPQRQNESLSTGTFLLSYSAPLTSQPPLKVLTITCSNAILILSKKGTSWTIKVLSEDPAVLSFAGPASGPDGESYECIGVKEEVGQFVRGVLGRGEEENKGQPGDALWDLAFIQAGLDSQGRRVEILRD